MNPDFTILHKPTYPDMFVKWEKYFFTVYNTAKHLASAL
jgi:hypothetical protein